MEKAVPRLSAKSSKEEMLKAYNDLVSRYQEKSESAMGRQAEAARVADAAVVEKASKYTVESIIKGIADLNRNGQCAFERRTGITGTVPR
ncbi:MAG: hypothetical protein FJW26_01005 [Acidimicrobiia bacterium]|nr:hypothetical protein [Acidimicrobiia bacterium]